MEKIITDCDICGEQLEWTSAYGPICEYCTERLGSCVSHSQRRRLTTQLTDRSIQRRAKQEETEE